ncbi:hypothetical protein INT45_001854 [Circinella minor]|uniref:UBA domain-containing protein n=1 Tax=Circinella minor TaxID=1195481 RepID=A0A8H7VI23_9FUNG|nr:hypothetical protein INT45_001854 [Circinella minor]
MATEEKEQAITTLQDLGISRKQAVKALARYGYDVGRAADYVFSGNAIDTDSENENDTQVSDTNKRNDNEKIINGKQVSSSSSSSSLSSLSAKGMIKLDDNNNNNNDNDNNNYTEDVPFFKDTGPKHLIKDFDRKAESSTTVSYDPAMWSVVPAKPDLNTNVATPSLTWWVDPEDPSDRLAALDVPIGLRPPQFNHPYLPVILQSLFHITLFQYRVLAYRPTAAIWGSTSCYWEGSGESVPSLQRPICHDSSENNENNNIDNDVSKSLTNTVKSVAELQKLFAFLGYSKRQYVNISQFARSLDTKDGKNGNWDMQDMSIDEFMEIIINILLEADNQRDTEEAVENFHSLFSLRARVEYGGDVDNEEIFYLTLNFTEQTLSFHECLGPLVYESGVYEDDDASDNLSFSSDEVSLIGGRAFKLTTFERVPPILLVTLEDKTLNKTRAGSNTYDKYRVDKTLYMDRYLFENREKILESHKQAQEWRDEIKHAKERIAKLKDNNVLIFWNTSFDQGKTVTMDKREILSKTIDYFAERSTEETIQSLQSVLGQVQDTITARLEEMEGLVKQRSNDLQNLFDGPEYHKIPYDIRAILHHDGMNGPGHYWGYIWVEPGEENLLQDIPNDMEGWFRFCDANVRPSNEEEIFNESLNPFAVYVDKDNEEFEEEIQAYNRRDHIIEERANSPGLTDPGDGDSVSTGDAGSTGTAVGGHIMTLMDESQESEQNPPAEPPADSASQEQSISESERMDSSFSFEERQQQIEKNKTFAVTNEYILQENLNEYINMLLFTMEQCSGDDYRLLKNFEAFLAKLRNSTALEYCIYTYTDNREGEAPIFREEESRKDNQLGALWFEFDKFTNIGSIVTRALVEFDKERYQEATVLFIQAQQEEAKWKAHLLMETDMLERLSNIEDLGFTGVIQRFGKQCIKVLNERAQTKAADPAYRTRGLKDAIQVARYAQTIIGPEKLASDPTFGEMREEWLRYSELQGANLKGSQADLLNELIMAYLETESAMTNEPHGSNLTASPIFIQDDLELVWEKYQRALQNATIRFNDNF